MQQSGPPKLRLDAKAFESILTGGNDAPELPPTPPAAQSEQLLVDEAIEDLNSRQGRLNCRILSAMALVEQQIKEARSRLSHVEARLSISSSATKRMREDRLALKALSRNLKQLADEVAALRDDSRDRARTVADPHPELVAQLQKMSANQAALEHRLRAMEQAQAAARDRIALLESRVTLAEARTLSVESRFEAAQATVNIDEDRLGAAHQRLDAVEKTASGARHDADTGRLFAEEISYRVESTARTLTHLERRLESLLQSAPTK
jgi:chromosome segregation ATPase